MNWLTAIILFCTVEVGRDVRLHRNCMAELLHCTREQNKPLLEATRQCFELRVQLLTKAKKFEY